MGEPIGGWMYRWVDVWVDLIGGWTYGRVD